MNGKVSLPARPQEAANNPVSQGEAILAKNSDLETVVRNVVGDVQHATKALCKLK